MKIECILFRCAVRHQPYLFYSNDIIIQSKTHFNITLELLVFYYAEKTVLYAKFVAKKNQVILSIIERWR